MQTTSCFNFNDSHQTNIYWVKPGFWATLIQGQNYANPLNGHLPSFQAFLCEDPRAAAESEVFLGATLREEKVRTFTNG